MISWILQCRSCVLLLFLCVSLVGQATAAAPDPDPAPYCRHAVYGELLGQGILYSLNYDYLLTRDISLRAGVTAWALEVPDFSMKAAYRDRQKELVGFPLMINYLAGEQSAHLELGVGVIPTAQRKLDPNNPPVLFTATIGYRSQSPEGGFVFRVGLTPLFTFEDFFLPMVGISFGHAF